MKKERLESFQNFEVDPSPDLWKKIEKELPAKKKRRWFLIWILTGIIISAAGIKYFMDDNSTPVISHAENKIQNTSHIEMRSETIQVANNYIKRNYIKTESGIKSTDEIINTKPTNDVKINSSNSSRKTKDNQNNKNSYYNAKTNTSKENIIEDRSVEKNNEFDNLITIDAIKNSFADENPSGEIISREIKPVSKKRLTRWILFAGAAMTKSSIKPYVDTTNEYTQSIKGISDFTFGGGIRYDLNNRIRISLGFTLITRGQERSGLNNIILQGQPMDPNNTYSINTGIGNITGLGTSFDQTFFNSSDSVLFPLTAHVIVTEETVKTREFTLKEEFKYFEFPLMITIRANERRITPNAGLILSTGYLSSHSIELDGKKLDYDYEKKLSKYIFSAGVTAGIDFHILRDLDFFVNGFYEKNLNSVITGDNKWKPYVYGAGAGINFRISRNGY